MNLITIRDKLYKYEKFIVNNQYSNTSIMSTIEKIHNKYNHLSKTYKNNINKSIKNNIREYKISSSNIKKVIKRVFTGYEIAKIKYKENPRKFIAFILKEQEIKIYNEIANPAVENKIINRLQTYPLIIPQINNIVKMYKHFIMPITKEIQVQFLLNGIFDLSVGYLGPTGTYSHKIALKAFDNKKYVLLPYNTMDELMHDFQKKIIHYAVIPTYNSIIGELKYNFFARNFNEYKKLTCPIELCIASNYINGNKLYIHPYTYLECKNVISNRLKKGIRVIYTNSNVDSIKKYLSNQKNSFCITDIQEAVKHNLKLIVRLVIKNNITTFHIINHN